MAQVVSKAQKKYEKPKEKNLLPEIKKNSIGGDIKISVEGLNSRIIAPKGKIGELHDERKKNSRRL